VYLLDTNVISELRKARPHGAVIKWLQSAPQDHVYISAATFGELQVGAERTRAHDQAKALEIEQWIDAITVTHRIIPIDARIARERARLLSGRSLALYEDAIIAATARIHRLIVITRNVKDFEVFSVPIINPFLE
jgi:predicted nucleic acid-binding protein